jgi:hypothetical protein
MLRFSSCATLFYKRASTKILVPPTPSPQFVTSRILREAFLDIKLDRAGAATVDMALASRISSFTGLLTKELRIISRESFNSALLLRVKQSWKSTLKRFLLVCLVRISAKAFDD